VFYVVQAQLPGWSVEARIASALVVTTGITLVSWYAVEQPCLRLKHRLAPGRTRVEPPRLVLGPERT
jgi:peptidoglycan/LPS O-acetylase OafA/YrhL